MSEQQAPPEDKPEIVDNPELGTGTEEQTQAEIDWQKQYQNLQPEYTRTAQEAAELRREKELYRTMVTAEDPAVRREAAEALGYAVEADEDDFADPTEHLAREIAQIKESLGQKAQVEQQQAVERRDVEHIGSGLAAVAKQLGRDLTNEEIQILGDSAWSNRDEHGMPNIDGVGKAYLQVINSTVLPGYKQTKRAPHISAAGSAATKQPNLDNRQERQDWMLSQWRAANED